MRQTGNPLLHPGQCYTSPRYVGPLPLQRDEKPPHYPHPRDILLPQLPGSLPGWAEAGCRSPQSLGSEEPIPALQWREEKCAKNPQSKKEPAGARLLPTLVSQWEVRSFAHAVQTKTASPYSSPGLRAALLRLPGESSSEAVGKPSAQLPGLRRKVKHPAPVFLVSGGGGDARRTEQREGPELGSRWPQLSE